MTHHVHYVGKMFNQLLITIDQQTNDKISAIKALLIEKPEGMQPSSIEDQEIRKWFHAME